jgi:hypothetical protein
MVDAASGDLRLALAIADPALEGALLLALRLTGVTVDRYLAGDTLLTALRAQPVAAVLLDTALNRVTPATVREICAGGMPLLLLVSNSHREDWEEQAAVIFDRETDATILARALLSAASQHVPTSTHTAATVAADLPGLSVASEASLPTSSEPTRPPSLRQDSSGKRASVIAVAAAVGGVGCTTVAINLSLALGAVRRSVLVDLDLAHPCIAAYVAADILRNLAMLTRNEPRSPEQWHQALDGELQALDGRCPEVRLLLVIPDAGRGAAISAPFFERALPAIQRLE